MQIVKCIGKKFSKLHIISNMGNGKINTEIIMLHLLRFFDKNYMNL